MKQFKILLIAALLLQLPLTGDDTLIHEWNTSEVVTGQQAFKVGEYLKYRVHYGFVDAGEAELRVSRMVAKDSNMTYHLVGSGYSTGMFNWFFKVRDRYESYVDTAALVPYHFIRDVNEGGHQINREISFNRNTNTAYTEGKEYLVPNNVQDLLSAFYYARTLDVNNMQVNDYFDIEIFLDKEIYNMRMRYLGKETIKSDVGKFQCLKFRPVVQVGNVFRDEEALSLWVTNDNMHVPIRVQADILVGSIKMDLIEYRNTISPLKPLK